MKIATAGSVTSKRWRTMDITWSDLLDRLRTPLRTGESFAEYRRMNREEQGRQKGAAGGFVGGALSGGRRIAGAVYERWLITLDADEAGPDDWDCAAALCDWAMCAYTTHSHSPEHPRLRWVIPLRRAVTREEYEPLCRKAAELLGVMETLDASTYQAERLMYWPTAASDGEYICREQDGALLDPDALLALYGPEGAWKDVSLWPMADREREIVRREARHQADPEGKPGIVGMFCRAYDVPAAIDAFLPDVYEEAGPGRYTYAQGTTSAGAVLYGDGRWLYSNHASDPAWGQLCNAFDLVRIHKFGPRDEGAEQDRDGDGTKLPSYQAMCRWAAELPEVKRELAARAMARAEEDFADLRTEPEQTGGGAGDAERDGAESGRDMGWVDQLKTNHKTGEADPSINNAEIILRNDPNLRGAVAYNQFLARPVLRRDVPWRRRGSVRDTRNGEPWVDADDAGLRSYLERVWQLRGRQAIADAWSIICDENAFHPIRNYLDALEWDGTERLDTMLVRHLRAADSEYVRAATRKWMCAAVARVYEPGRKFDQMLVLVGPQGVGKSRLAKAISRGWFTDSLTTMNGKEAYEGLRGAWIVELAELAAARRSETETIKNFVSKQVDSYRPAYGRHTMDYPRQCVFYGTTNDPSFLKDRTGNRRFWPVQVAGLDRGRLTGLEEEVDQLWAEAVVRYRAGESLWMDTDELQDMAAEAAELYTVDDELVGYILDYLDKPLPENWEDLTVEDRRDYIQGRSLTDPGVCTLRRDTVSIPEIRMELLEQNRRDIGGRDTESRHIADILNNLPGWERTGKLRKRGPYGPQKVYSRVGAG